MDHKLKRHYLDYNATSLLSKKVTDFFKSKDVSFFNASSLHRSGISTFEALEDIKLFFLQCFSFSPADYEILFHSGLTEITNTLVYNYRMQNYQFINSKADHPCSLVLSNKNEFQIELLENGMPNLDSLEKTILSNSGKKFFLNWTIINNEIGVYWPIDNLLALKDKLFKEYSIEIIIHIDAAQLVGKISNWNEIFINKKIDLISFSGHKFGGITGIGFTIFNKKLVFHSNHKLNFYPLIKGGGQQENLRSGTINVFGIKTMELALSDALEDLENDTILKISELKTNIIKLALKIFKDEIIIPGRENLAIYAVNTIDLIFKKYSSDLIFPIFDLNGFDVSIGSACSSGGKKSSHVLKAINLDQYSMNSIRLSLGKENIIESSIILEKLSKVFNLIRNFK